MKQAAYIAWLGLMASYLFAGDACAATYRLAIEPQYPPEQARQVYMPLVQYLNKATGHQFELVLTRNYHSYWRDLREQTPVDFAFDEAHFADYRIQHAGFTPIARTAEPTTYVLLAQPQYDGQSIRALIGYPVATMSAPSLGFAQLAELYEDNPVAQPDIRSEATSWQEGVEMLFSGEVAGAIVPAFLADIYPNLAVLQRTQPIPGRAFTAAKTVPEEDLALVAKALSELHEDHSLYEVLSSLGATRFETATKEEYAGYERILSGFFGYRTRHQDSNTNNSAD